MFQRTLPSGLCLQLLEEQHAPQVFAVVDGERAHLRTWLPWVDANAAVGDTHAFIQTALRQFSANEGMVAGIWREGEFAGTIGAHNLDRANRKTELGYWIASRFQGRGIVTEACRALVTHCFDEWKLHRVEIHCATGNLKSCAIPERLGFRREGLLREAYFVNGRFHDLNIYAVLGNEWEQPPK